MMATATDALPPITTSDEKAVPDSTTADEKVAPTSTSADNYIASEITSGDETNVDEKDVPERPVQEEEEEEECGFCLFMKAGPCKEQFEQWQECVEGAEKSEKDIVEQCAQMTTLLKVCMEANPQYYGPVLDAEKAMQADIDSAEENRMDTSKSSEPPAGEGVDNGDREQTVETLETSMDGSKSSESPAVKGVESGNGVQTVETLETHTDRSGRSESLAVKGVESENGEQAVATMETMHVVINDDGQVVEAVDLVEVEVNAL